MLMIKFSKVPVFLLCGMLVLSACSRPGASSDDADAEAKAAAPEKKEFVVEVESLRELSSQPTLRKTGKLTGKSDVTVSAQSSGRVGRIFFDEGDTPNK